VGRFPSPSGVFWARGPPEPCETRRQASADPLVWAQLLAVGAQRSPGRPVNQGPDISKEGRSVGTRARVLNEKQIPFDCFPFLSSPPDASGQPAAEAGHRQHDGHDLRVRSVTCAPPSCRPTLSSLLAKDRNRLNISHMTRMARWPCTRVGRGDRI
jgi:hypothetical protein